MADGFYLGKLFSRTDKSLGEPFLLDPGDLTTHGIIIGMTGSGKTGLSVGMIEEALKARIPVIVIDPKGDMGNLALAFDRLAPDQFEPWVDRDEASREGKTVAQLAADAAASWQKGLADWGLQPSDVASYAANHRTRVYTPGATAGIPLNLIDSREAPTGDFETVAGLVLATVHRLPLIGEEFQVGRHTFTVLEADPRRILTVRITPPSSG